ncbi:MAG: hypothetical protein J7502_17450 [Flavisolibacter sp.]|nr:hypothetical protein [Flavisolibacter sp.]
MRLSVLLITGMLLIQSGQAQELPRLLSVTSGPSFSYMECLNKLPKKKDRHCNRYDFTIKIENDTLYIAEAKFTNTETTNPKEMFTEYFKIRLKDIYLSESLSQLSGDKERSSIKDMEGNTQTMHSFTIYSIGSTWIWSHWWGGKFVEEKASSHLLYSESYSDSKAFLEYFKGKAG